MKEFWKELNIFGKIALVFGIILVIAAHVAAFWALIDINLLVPGIWVRVLVLVTYTTLIFLDIFVTTFIIFD